MYISPMFAFAEQELAMRVVPSSDLWLFICFIIICNALYAAWILFLLRDLRSGLKVTVQGLNTVSNNHRIMFRRMEEQLEEAKKTNEILSKLTVKKNQT